MAFQIKRATKQGSKLKMALCGSSGSGKSLSSLLIARGLIGPQGRILFLDSEHGSGAKYADVTEFDIIDDITAFSPQNYTQVIELAQKEGYDCLILDSLSHAWSGTGGALDIVNNTNTRQQSGGNSFAAWRHVTPLHNAMIDAIIFAKIHIIATMRSKTEYVQEKNERTGKLEVRKVGMAPVQRDGMEYEFDVVGDLDQEHNLIITKTRCQALDGQIINRPGENFAQIVRQWLSDVGNRPGEDSDKSTHKDIPRLVGPQDWKEKLLSAMEGWATPYLIETIKVIKKAHADNPQIPVMMAEFERRRDAAKLPTDSAGFIPAKEAKVQQEMGAKNGVPTYIKALYATADEMGLDTTDGPNKQTRTNRLQATSDLLKERVDSWNRLGEESASTVRHAMKSGALHWQSAKNPVSQKHEEAKVDKDPEGSELLFGTSEEYQHYVDTGEKTEKFESVVATRSKRGDS